VCRVEIRKSDLVSEFNDAVQMSQYLFTSWMAQETQLNYWLTRGMNNKHHAMSELLSTYVGYEGTKNDKGLYERFVSKSSTA
jgi:hypothetical protein